MGRYISLTTHREMSNFTFVHFIVSQYNFSVDSTTLSDSNHLADVVYKIIAKKAPDKTWSWDSTGKVRDKLTLFSEEHSTRKTVRTLPQLIKSRWFSEIPQNGRPDRDLPRVIVLRYGIITFIPKIAYNKAEIIFLRWIKFDINNIS